MGIYHFHYNTKYAQNLRDVINERQKFSLEKEHKHEKYNYVYFAWDRICAIMDRLDDTLEYINGMELGGNVFKRSAFDFYEFINCAYVIIDCIKTMGRIFDIDRQIFKNVENSQEVFGDEYSDDGTDHEFFSYIRSLCVVHPLCTSNHEKYIRNVKFHCCPYVIWERNGNLVACIYTSQVNNSTIRLQLHINQFEEYLKKWIELIPQIIEAKEKYVDDIYEEFKKIPIKSLDDFDGNVIDYLTYLKIEYSNRFGDDQEYIFDDYIRVFNIRLTNEQNSEELEKYKNAIKYALPFMRNAIQNMSFMGYENTGIKNLKEGWEIDLFTELDRISCSGGLFVGLSYNVQKLYYLDPCSGYHYFDKKYARILLDEIKDIINKYVVFTNEESDEEVIVLVNLALYFNALTYDNILNKNIPNEEQYRQKCLTQEEMKCLKK